MAEPFAGFDLSDFWEKSDAREYTAAPLTDGMVARVQRELGFTLPAAYVALMRVQNGGIPARTCHRTTERTSWATDYIAITGIFGVGDEPDLSLLGENGSRFWMTEWGYPKIGIYFGDCPSAGHDMICLDYSACGHRGAPRVVHVDQERDYKITHVADNFESFIRGLEPNETFRDP